MIISTISKSNKKQKIIAVIFWLAVWQAVYMLIDRKALFPSPLITLQTLAGLLVSVEFYKTVFFTLLRILAGFFAGTVFAVILGALSGKSNTVWFLFKPVVDVVRATPVASFIILVLAWITSGRVPIFIAFLTVVPIVWSNIVEGIRSVDTKLLEMAEVYEFTPKMKLTKIYIPSVKPYFRSAVITGAGFAFKSGVAAEVIGSPAFSIGRKLSESKTYLEMDALFAWTIAIIVLSVIFEKLLVHFIGEVKK